MIQEGVDIGKGMSFQRSLRRVSTTEVLSRGLEDGERGTEGDRELRG